MQPKMIIMKNIYKLSLSIFLIFIFTSFNNKKKVLVCAGGGYYMPSPSFFSPITFDDIINNNYNNSYYYYDKTPNLTAWQNFFGKQVEIGDINQIVYKVALDTLTQIQEQILEHQSNFTTKLDTNSLVQYWQQGKESESLEYLIFAKQCEPLVVSPSRWHGSKAEIEAKVANKMISIGQKKYKKTQSKFLKVRFAYQIIRLAHYSKQYKKAVKLYKKLLEPIFDSPSILKYWAMEHKAGALNKIGKSAEAMYWFSIVFMQSPTKKSSSFNSFHIESDEMWQETMSFCKTAPEKANLHFMRALQNNADVLAEMKDIYKLYPQSENLEALLTSLIDDLEGSFLSYSQFREKSLNKPLDTPNEEDLAYLLELQSFLNEVNQGQNTRQPYLWICAEAYTYFLRKNYDQALSILNQGQYPTTKAQKVKKTMDLAIQIAQLTKVDDKTEVEFYTEVKKTENGSLRYWMRHKFSNLYLLQNEEAKAFLATEDIDYLRSIKKSELVDKILAWLKTDMNIFEKEVLLASLIKNAKPIKKEAEENVLELKATILFKQNKLEEAVNIYKNLSKTPNLIADPFKANINDCLYCDRVDNPANIYTRFTLAQKLLTMQKQAKKEQNPKIYFDLGVAFYNMTYFGNSWDGHQYFRYDSDLHYRKYRKEYEINPPYYKTDENFDCSEALYYFNKAIYFAEQNHDKELEAKATFFAAKCEQNNYFLSDVFDDSWFPEYFAFDVGYGNYFKKLKKDYRNTQFYQETLKECFYLKMYDSK